ncbi:DUF2442 domain-containing protein [Acidithiobacillus sp. IBUN Pt1247-S3]|uniref:DUF2442 domain-containing protein n=1 Tax=Acidithiobacillus sp. IBUN Pt1247-S3 TaxID=3166642 RepID=UPI0034E4484E
MFLIDITAVRPLQNRALELTFADGLKGIVNLNQIVRQYTGVFAPLLDDDFFRQVSLNRELGTIVWPNGADICPDVLYSYASGKPVMINGQRVLN